MKKKTKILHYSILAGILLLAVFLRVYNIDNAPSGIYPDEANNGTNAYDAMISGDYQWFYPDNNGREGLFLNMIGISFKLFDVSMFSLKLPSIIFGVLTVLGVYLLCRELFRTKPHLALIASYLTAVSFWAINFSRIGFRAIMLPAILTFTFYFLFRGLRTFSPQKKNYLHLYNFVIAGFIFGLGMHSYIAFRIAPLILITILIALLITYRHFLKSYWHGILLFVFFAFLAAAPMLWTFHAHPELVNSRSGSISILSEEVNGGNLFGTLAETVTLSLAKFNFYGDPNWRHGYPPYPTLELITGIAFLFGIIYSFIHFFKSIFTVNKERQKDHPSATNTFVIYTFLLCWFFVMLIPEFMTREGLPHALRSIGVLPVVYIFAALTFDFVLTAAKKRSVQTHAIVLAFVLIALFYIGLFNTIKYHIFWAQHPKVAFSFNKDLTDIGRYVQTLPSEQMTYVVTGSLTRLPVLLLNEEKDNLVFLYDHELDQINQAQEHIVLIGENDEYLAVRLREQDPDLAITKHMNDNSHFYEVKKKPHH